MDRLQKKCFLASAVLHGFLLLVLLVGSAFLVPQQQKIDLPRVHVVPTLLVDNALAGGGGNPNVKPSDAQQKGNTLTPQPPKPVEPPAPKPPRQVKPPPEPAPTPAPKKVAEKSPKEKPSENLKPIRPDPNAKAKDAPLELKPVTRSGADKVKAQQEAEQRAWTETSRKVAKQLGNIQESLRSGFSQGTQVEVWGTGGAAYADYRSFVKSVYDDAWEIADTMTDDNSTVKVEVIIARSGNVLSAQILQRSGNPALDRSVQRALNKVKFVAPFPAGSKDQERTFTIYFDLKSKRLIG